MSKIETKPPRGTRDFYPEDLRLRSWLFEHFRTTADRFAFEEVDAPVVEHADLFARKAGEEIMEQLYHFTLHDRHLALRGEFTPSLARMVMARAGALRFPIRWFAIPQCWRYERMTRGRRREHYQWNMDVWGEPSVTAEAELIAAACEAMGAMGLGSADVRMRISSRALLEEALHGGVLADAPQKFEPLCVIIDKLDKIGADAVVDLLCDADGPVGLAEAEARVVIEMLGARGLDEAARFAPKDSPALADLRRLFELLDAYGLSDWAVFDASVVRGLAYYTGIVFEAFASEGDLRAICGGGRYDGLLESLGGPRVPAAGFGFGDVVILELLSDRGLLPELGRQVDDVVFAFGPPERAAATRLASDLRRRGRRVELVLGTPKPKRALADADRAGARRIWLLGPDERERGVVRVRDLSSGEERDEKLAP
ncbi:MAG: histidine--tRNA ligase [Myxococcota bacterium]